MTLLCIFIGLLLVYSLISALAEETVLTAPILFTAGGMLVMSFLPEQAELKADQGLFRWVAEIGLVMLLFADASRTNLRVLSRISNLPARLLSVGMLLTILLGALAALAVLRDLTLWEAGILAAILAPTDAGLGQVIVKSPRVPMRIREALNVEAGLNDGLAVPFMMFFIALTGTAAANPHAVLAGFIFEQLGYGALIGAGIGLFGGYVLALARRRHWMALDFQKLGLVALPLLCMLVSDAVGASMFIAAFVAGLAVQVGFKTAAEHSVEFIEGWGQLLNLFVFFFFGLMMALEWHHLTAPLLLYAVLSLTVVRMLPVAVALIGTRLSRATVLFIGWFGPRGLASLVLGLVYLEQEGREPAEATIRLAVMVTVLLSIFAHGISALPGINLYATNIAALDASAPEHCAVEEGAPNQRGPQAT